MVHTDVIELLVSNGLGTFGEDLFWGTMPSQPDELIAGYDGLGAMGLYTKQGPARSEARLEFLARAPAYGDAMARAVELYDFLNNRRWIDTGVTYNTRPLHRPFDVGAPDENDRVIISCNYSITLM